MSDVVYISPAAHQQPCPDHGNKNVALNEKISHLSRRSTKEKLLSYLSDCAKKAQSMHFTIPFDRQELADYLCVERSAMSAELGKLKKTGILDCRKNEFWLKEM